MNISMVKKHFSIALAMLIAAALFPAAAGAAAPTAETLPATPGSSTYEATLKGKVFHDAGEQTVYLFHYGTTSEYGEFTEVTEGSQWSTSYTAQTLVDGLKPDTTYHYRVVVLSNQGVAYGQDETFKTRPVHFLRFESDSYPATVTGSQEGGNVFSGNPGTASCSSRSFSGTATGASATLDLGSAASGCTAFSFASATVKMGSCKYNVALDKAGPPASAKLGVSCLPADAIEIATSGCTVKIPAQSPRSGIAVSNGGTTLSVQVTGLTYNVLSGCTTAKSGTYSNGSYSGTVYLSGTRVTGEGTQGLFITGKESSEPPAQPRFELEGYPAPLSSVQYLPFGFEAVSGNLECSSSTFTGEAAAASSSIRLDAQHSGCTAWGQAATVKLNSCAYQLGVANAGPPYTGTFGVACANEGDKIEIATAGCTVTIPAQSGHGTAALENLGSGAERRLNMPLGNVTGFAYSVLPGCLFAKAGAYSNGGLKGGYELWGFETP